MAFGGVVALDNVSISIGADELLAVIGPNGAGKTSLMNVLAGRHPRSGGELRLMGERLGRVTAQEMARRGVAYVPQGRAIFPMLSVRENLETGLGCLPRGARGCCATGSARSNCRHCRRTAWSGSRASRARPSR